MTRSKHTSAGRLAVNPEDINRLLSGVYHDPHAILGAHDDRERTVIRTLRPGAAAVTVLVGGDRLSMKQVAEGLFAATLPFADLIDYRLLIDYPGVAEPQTVADGYRFLPTLGEVDLHLFAEGRHERLWDVLGAHPRAFTTADGTVTGVSFAVWAPNARGVGLISDVTGWEGIGAPMRALGSSGVWELFWPGFPIGGLYKFRIHGADDVVTERADPMAFSAEVPPQTASRVTTSGHTWHDDEWMSRRPAGNPALEAMSIYEVHLGSWRPGLSYRQLAVELT
ncbi:GlgB N-terminal domain-containing protein, partial [Mycolicibacter algericus]